MNKHRRTLVVEFVGGPSIGKSTLSHSLYVLLKQRHCLIELAREYVKRWAWEGRTISSEDQYYLFGKQAHEESSLCGKVDVVVADMPVFMSTVYADLYTPAEVSLGIHAAVDSYYAASYKRGHRRVAVLLERHHPYVEAGRFESEAAARDIDGVVADRVGEGAATGRYVEVLRLSRDSVDYCDVHDVVSSVSSWLRRRKS